ncbi:MAG TPA: hypothetical protein VJT72_07765 [Pseudonocardiaceae bacterium]|nr:hypothetical protein [Pseudonocardiaceae bacterium]
MADWPTLAMLKQALGVDRSDKDDLLEQALGAAIEGVVDDCGGDPVEVTFSSGTPTVALFDSPVDDETPIEIDVNDRLAAAALLLATTVMKAPDAPFGVASTFDTGGIYVARNNPNYTRLIKGNRLRFGIG